MPTIKTDDVVYREDLYPRFELNQKLVQRYADNVDKLPPIELNQDNILIDGKHRLTAYQIKKKDKIEYTITETASEKELKKLAYQRNSHHGLQLTQDEKKQYAQEMIGEQMTADELHDVLSVSESTINRWTKSKRDALKKQRNRKIVELYLRGWNTQEDIAGSFDITRRAVGNIIDNGKKTQMRQISKEWNLSSKDEDYNKRKPFTYGIWRLGKQDNKSNIFGAFPQIYMENLLYYHTDPLDLVFDPFAGSGTTIDACKAMFRRYYCTDLTPQPGREEDIRQYDIADGLPSELPKPGLAFLDPPYWIQSKGEYSDSENDLGNMSLDDFYDVFASFLKKLTDWQVPRIAVVIQPTQYANEDHKFEDHILHFAAMFPDNYYEDKRYILPYSTQQYNPQQVKEMKGQKQCLVLHRDLAVWEIKG